jgi:hypothetical protein
MDNAISLFRGRRVLGMIERCLVLVMVAAASAAPIMDVIMLIFHFVGTRWIDVNLACATSHAMSSALRPSARLAFRRLCGLQRATWKRVKVGSADGVE